MTDKSINLRVGGEAGQGLDAMGEILARALVRQGSEVVVTRDYQSRIRGGHNTYDVRTGTGRILAPREKFDLILAMNEETAAIDGPALKDNGLILVDEKTNAESDRIVKIPLQELAEARYRNVAALAVLAAAIGLGREILTRAARDRFAKAPEAADGNAEAIGKAFKWAASAAGLEGKKLPAPEVKEKRLLLNGNQAIALGALSSGLKFYSFYPMTPATSIGLTLASAMKTMDVVVEQAEDEIAAINMALGASFTGAPAMVGTSGGGFALMTEGVSLAAMAEIPAVIAISQRPGPATGLPASTEQADLEFALHAGHGEFPRAVYAPGTVEQCFHLTRAAFQTAEKFRGPVIILTDQFLADSFRAVLPFDLDRCPPISVGMGNRADSSPYKSYALTESGASPRLLPGMSDALVGADSDEHDEFGHISEDPEVRRQMADKRLKKGEGMLGEAIGPDYHGPPDADLLLVCWGSTLGSAIEAASMARDKGVSAAVMHFSQVWPLRKDEIISAMGKARRIVALEGNATAQFARLLRRETGVEIKDFILRYDGYPITPEYVLRELG